MMLARATRNLVLGTFVTAVACATFLPEPLRAQQGPVPRFQNAGANVGAAWCQNYLGGGVTISGGCAQIPATGSGTVTSISQTTGITLAPNPITATGTVAVDQSTAFAWTGSQTYDAANFTFTNTRTHFVTAAQSSSGAGTALNWVGSTGADAVDGVSDGQIGGTVVFRGGPGGKGSANQNPGAGQVASLIGGAAGALNGSSGGASGGNATVEGGTKTGTGTAGSANIGVTQSSAVNIGHSTIPITTAGSSSSAAYTGTWNEDASSTMTICGTNCTGWAVGHSGASLTFTGSASLYTVDGTGSCTGAIGSGATKYFTAVGATCAAGQVPITMAAFAGTIKNLYAGCGTAPGVGQTLTITVQTSPDGATWTDSGVTCVISGAAQSCNDTTHTVALAAGSLAAIKAVQTAGAAANCTAAYIDTTNP